jgi:hypothetical protein
MAGCRAQHETVPAHLPALTGARVYLIFVAPFVTRGGEQRRKARLRITTFKAQEYLEDTSPDDFLESPARESEQIIIAKRYAGVAVEHDRCQVQMAQNLAEALLVPVGYERGLIRDERVDDRGRFVQFDNLLRGLKL